MLKNTVSNFLFAVSLISFGTAPLTTRVRNWLTNTLGLANLQPPVPLVGVGIVPAPPPIVPAPQCNAAGIAVFQLQIPTAAFFDGAPFSPNASRFQLTIPLIPPLLLRPLTLLLLLNPIDNIVDSR